MKKPNILFDQRKVKDHFIIEVWKYNVDESKDVFFEHYKKMQARRFKNDRSKDIVKDGYLYVTYAKNILAVEPKKNYRKGRV